MMTNVRASNLHPTFLLRDILPHLGLRTPPSFHGNDGSSSSPLTLRRLLVGAVVDLPSL